jgi:hypothetical protein
LASNEVTDETVEVRKQCSDPVGVAVGNINKYLSPTATLGITLEISVL